MNARTAQAVPPVSETSTARLAIEYAEGDALERPYLTLHVGSEVVELSAEEALQVALQLTARARQMLEAERKLGVVHLILGEN